MGYEEYDETDVGVTETDTLYEDGAGNLYVGSEVDAEVDQYSADLYVA